MEVVMHEKSPDNVKAFCDPAGTRTQGPIIKSDVLYQLSYEINLIAQTVYLNGVQKYSLTPFAPKLFRNYSDNKFLSLTN